jgi:biopolymer transport protein ExbD
MKVRRQRKATLAVDMSPLIDCVFQLLVFFMLSSTFLTPAMRIQLPSAQASQPQDAPQVLVAIASDGSISVNHRVVSLSKLQQEVAAQLVDSEKKVVTIHGDQKSAYQQFVEVLAIVRRAGASQVDIAHETGQE